MQSVTKTRLVRCLVVLVWLGSPATSAAVTFGTPKDNPVGTSPRGCAYSALPRSRRSFRITSSSQSPESKADIGQNEAGRESVES